MTELASHVQAITCPHPMAMLSLDYKKQNLQWSIAITTQLQCILQLPPAIFTGLLRAHVVFIDVKLPLPIRSMRHSEHFKRVLRSKTFLGGKTSSRLAISLTSTTGYQKQNQTRSKTHVITTVLNSQNTNSRRPDKEHCSAPTALKWIALQSQNITETSPRPSFSVIRRNNK